jgi:hypothetical protein
LGGLSEELTGDSKFESVLSVWKVVVVVVVAVCFTRVVVVADGGGVGSGVVSTLEREVT